MRAADTPPLPAGIPSPYAVVNVRYGNIYTTQQSISTNSIVLQLETVLQLASASSRSGRVLPAQVYGRTYNAVLQTTLTLS